MSRIYPDHERLKMELRLRGKTMTQLAADIGVLPGTVTTVSQGRRRSKKIEAALAEAVGKTVFELFPARYRKEKEDK